MILTKNMRNVFGAALGVAMLGALLMPGTAGAWSMHKSQRAMPNTVVDVAVANGNFTTLAAALTCTGLVPALDNNYRRFTVFAPTDAAFGKLGLNKDNVCTSFDQATLKNILLYHVDSGARDANKVLRRKSLTMLNHQKAYIDAIAQSIDGQKIVTPNVRATNGIIHVIDGVMLP